MPPSASVRLTGDLVTDAALPGSTGLVEPGPRPARVGVDIPLNTAQDFVSTVQEARGLHDVLASGPPPHHHAHAAESRGGRATGLGDLRRASVRVTGDAV
ncbi:hypothetical protein GCM10012275_62080 [Longimycelium tulufanense]|uniref:Uncharacterized protein n=1 Tax=Longimycelium tulufanense TaxID=907463 RepID=A0A8J3FZR8_9PSEU|nr:hypothetical protein GCM10012275_62080 [Longimycelium tulufanense]